MPKTFNLEGFFTDMVIKGHYSTAVPGMVELGLKNKCSKTF
jgi:hypothetical protein